ncbi:GTP binding [Tritrichomonas musculus]|uniref:GTP binding n=1 Tax=Tritrichomonas musculus TaxID=1915356 RepID=A0ABR2KZA9_9EUKA
MKKKWFQKKKADPIYVNIIVIGLDNAGKSTILNKLKPEGSQEAIIHPTQGINQPWIEHNEFYLRFRDLSGSSNYRPIWQQYADDLNGIIFVVDSSDTFRFSTAADELHAFLSISSVQAKSIPVLILANKNDMENSAPVETIEKELCLNEIHNHPVYIASVSSYSPKDIFTAIEWLIARRA